MPKGDKLIKTGGFIRSIKCPFCDKKYEGNPKTVDKIIKLHLKTHNISNPQIIKEECIDFKTR